LNGKIVPTKLLKLATKQTTFFKFLCFRILVLVFVLGNEMFSINVIGSVANRKLEWQVHKASHCGSKQQ